jgi:hypothetical protein
VSPAVSGDTVYYRVYERDPNTTDGNWMQISSDPLTSTSFTDDGYCNTRDYRVSAYETDSADAPGSTATPKESNFSAPLNVPTQSPTC